MTLWAVIGCLGIGAFTSRFIVQWLASEKAGHSVAPTAFWWLSLTGSLCMGTYTYHEGELVLLAGHVLNGALFARNLHLSLRPKAEGARHPLLGVLALAMTATVIWLSLGSARAGLVESPVWFAISVLGTCIWSSRFVVQWWQSEGTGQSHFPVLFWWISLVGNMLLLAYTSHLGKPILIAGYLTGPLVQARNLMLGQGPKRSA